VYHKGIIRLETTTRATGTIITNLSAGLPLPIPVTGPSPIMETGTIILLATGMFPCTGEMATATMVDTVVVEVILPGLMDLPIEWDTAIHTVDNNLTISVTDIAP